MSCQICGSEEIAGKCILCEIELCESCLWTCKLSDSDVCTQKAGDFVIYRCPGTYCPSCRKRRVIFECKSCKLMFCKSLVDNWAKACPTCKDYICGNCFDTHIKICSDFYDKEKALNKIFNLIEGDKQKEKS